MMHQAFCGSAIFDGTTLHPDAVLLVEGAHVLGLSDHVPKGATEMRLPPGTLSPGFLDLQLNGGGGHMVGPLTDAASLARLCVLHQGLGATEILPTLITDTPEVTARVIAAGVQAARALVPGFLGLHLEGPHLDPKRQGAHDPDLIRPMTPADLAMLCQAAADLPCLMVTLAPAAVTPGQIRALAQAGVIVSLGHAEASYAEAQAAIAAGARCVTHLFNAMSQLGNRAPGLVGAVLSSGIAAGLIADGHHVAPEVLRIAMAARPDGLFLVSDCMAAAGSDEQVFAIGGRRVTRKDGTLRLDDGTLAGADLTLPRAVQVMVQQVGLPLAQALAMATRTPATVIRRPDLGHLQPGAVADMVHLSVDLTLTGVWRAAQRVA
jgi:N-acetylglucosamine-6-phosphate deacetylase